MKTVIWDWNGTLLDDVELCLELINGLLAARGLSTLDLEGYRAIFDFPVRDYYARAGLDLDKEDFELLAEEYMRVYKARARACPLAHGAEETLRALKEAGCRQLILSASDIDTLREQVEERNIAHFFDEILGGDNIYARGKTDLGIAWAKEHERDLPEALFVGDTAHDGEVADAMGLRCLLIAKGHHGREKLEKTGAFVADDIADVLGYVRKL